MCHTWVRYLLVGRNRSNFYTITSNDVGNLSPGKFKYTCFPNNDGGIVDDFLLYMLEEDSYLQ